VESDMRRYSDEQKQEVKNNLQKVLMYYGLIPGKPNWTCLSTRHSTPKGSLSVKGNVCCCSCGLEGDVFNIISIIEGLDLRKDFGLIIRKGLEILNCNIEPPEIRLDIISGEENEENKITDLTDIITEAFKKAKWYQYKYFWQRGINQISLIKKYRILYCNPKEVFTSDLLPNLYNLHAYRNIIPIWQDKKVVNCILRRDDYLSMKNTKVLNLKNVPVKIFNAGYISHTSLNDFIFITEGIFDALSFENEGYKAIALNSVTMYKTLLFFISENIDQLKKNNVRFLICLDNDLAGKEFGDKLDYAIRSLNIPSYLLRFSKYKDVNEYYVNSKELFLKAIESTIRAIKMI